ncbi:60S ribosomal subunit assembly/export protein [Saxophila tyrrhenica]|uniref:60S ribosomal subunit assembly/export protein n=1 Tax=Saxophila tyrrhenica TaxID=1690608 RepID=A0AAV9NUZ4_9PEZI|nr:60S ribosomal subunit assembly/export protein [Saxophila tyrrhenica]
MPTKVKTGSAKGANKRSTKPSSSGSTSKTKKKPSGAKPAPTQHKPAARTAVVKKKPPHLRYTEKDLKVPALNGIRPSGVQKLPNKKKGKKFVDDGEGMRTILAMVMADKEGDVESKMMRARQLEEVREARRVEMESRAQAKKEGLEERKMGIRSGRRKRGRGGEVGGGDAGAGGEEKVVKKAKKRVSFG